MNKDKADTIHPANMAYPPDIPHRDEIQRLRQALNTQQQTLEKQQEALRETSQALQTSREAYHALYDQFPLGYFTLDEEGIIIEANLPGAELLGVTREKLITRPLSQFILPGDHKIFRMHCDQTLKATTQQTCELRMVRHNDAQFYAKLISTVIESHRDKLDPRLGHKPAAPNGHRRYWRTAINDISERKRTEHLILRSERLVAMGHIAASLAHEIKNPLQAIYSNLELVLDFDLTADERQTYLRLCRQEIEHLSEITKRVLNFTRTDADTRYAIPIPRLIQRALDLVNSPLQNTQVHITMDFPPDLPDVLVVPDQVVQVLLNLILNSIEAVPKGGYVHITAHVDGAMVVLNLINNGPPIPEKYLQHLFDPFFTTKANGTGLGLFISESIMKRHGGEINIENLPDAQGVSCTLTLPMAHFIEQADTTHPADKIHPEAE
jgi:PAS domain S-box-containing protein